MIGRLRFIIILSKIINANESYRRNASTLPNISVSIEPDRCISTGQALCIQLYVLVNYLLHLLGNILPDQVCSSSGLSENNSSFSDFTSETFQH